jgi:two-component system, LytTR family, sensor histidine kinase AgrC
MIQVLSFFSSEQLFVLSTEWVFSYTVYRFLSAFFDYNICRSRLYGICMYTVQLILNAVVYMFYNVPFMYLLINISMILLISLNYESSWIRRIVAAVLTYATGAIIEILIFGLTTKVRLFSITSESMPLSGIVLVRISFLCVAAIVGNLHNLRKGVNVPSFYWILIAVLFLFNFVIVLLITDNDIGSVPFLITVFMCLIENVLLFFLFDRMISLHERSELALISDLQNESYRRQLSIMNESLEKTKVMRHDMKNQMLTVQGLLEADDTEAALEHVRTMTGTWAAAAKSVDTGNIEVDSFINFKLSQAEQEHVTVTPLIRIPEQIGLRSFDMAAVIGNLFDNAFDALKKLPENDRNLSAEIKYSKGRIFIIFENPYTGTIAWKNGIPATRKRLGGMHGVGLAEVFTVAEKYNGQVNISTTDNLFKVTVMMYVD